MITVIRGLALGTLNERTRGQFMSREFRMAVALSAILSVAGFCRAVFFRTPFPEALAVTSALAMIVFSSVCLGAVLPLVLEWLGVDPAHSSTTIQGKSVRLVSFCELSVGPAISSCGFEPLSHRIYDHARNFVVIMDILGVIMAVSVSRAILDGPLGAFLIGRLGG